MTLAELQSLDFAALWAGLSDVQRTAIGVLAITNEFCVLVQEDDGSETTRDDRLAASEMGDISFAALAATIQASFPDVVWFDVEEQAGNRRQDNSEVAA